MSAEAVWDAERSQRIGLAEALMCLGKTPEQIAAICRAAGADGSPVLLTRLDVATYEKLPADLRAELDFDPVSRTGILGDAPKPAEAARIAVVTAGTADVGVAREAARTLSVYGVAFQEVYDVGVAGLWRLLDRIDEIKKFPIIIMVAGMDGAIFLGPRRAGSRRRHRGADLDRLWRLAWRRDGTPFGPGQLCPRRAGMQHRQRLRRRLRRPAHSQGREILRRLKPFRCHPRPAETTLPHICRPRI